MTKLVKLSLKNFKSFKKADIPIGKGFTAIVGSNGSGKSNVLDALLFVLGITSLKALRAGKLTDLINNNCKENYAKVAITIKDDKKTFEISRMIDKLGKSVYRIDDKRTTLNEVSSLLTDLGIDIAGHNIVTQGDITKVVNMSAMERRAIIDNIAGLSEFDQKKDEALKELGKVDTRIKEATIILNERTNFLEEMEKEMNAAQEYESLDKEKKQLKATIISKELYKIEKRINELDIENNDLEKQKEDIQKIDDELNKELIESKQKAKNLSSEAMQGSQDIYEKIAKAYEAKKGLLALEKERVENKELLVQKNNEKIKSNEEFLKNAKKEKDEFNNKLKEFSDKKKKIGDELKSISSKKEELGKIVSSKNNELKKIEGELDNKNKDIEKLRNEIFDIEVFVQQWEKQKAFNERKLNELNSEKENLENKLQSLNEKKKEILNLGGNEVIKKIEDFENEIEKVNYKLGELKASNKQEEKAILELEKEISKCPVCESNLDENKKKQLLDQKETIFKKNEFEIKELNVKLIELKEKLKSKIESRNKISKLEIEVEQISEINNKISEINNKIKLVKEELDQRSFESKLSKKKEFDIKIKNLLEDRENIKEKLKIKREQDIFNDFSNISKKQDELIHNKSLIDSDFNKISMELKTINSREESILIENEELSKEIKENLGEIKEKKPLVTQMEAEISGKEKELKEAQKANEAIVKEKEEIDKKIDKLELEIINQRSKIKRANDRFNEFNIEKSKLEVKQSDLQEESKQYENIEKLGEKTTQEMKERIIEVEKRLEEIGAVNLKAIENFSELKREVDEIQEKSEKLDEERMAVLDMIDKIDVKRTTVFMDCFNEVNKNFMDMFFKFFNGEGMLDLTNPNAPLESGLIIDAKPKGGKLQNIDSMSGGEKTLTALAFMFAIQLYSPAPFYAFDEADAALDKENSMKMGNLIEKIAEKSQFIAITHNDTITKKAHQIVGVALNRDHSSAIGLKLKNTNNAS